MSLLSGEWGSQPRSALGGSRRGFSPEGAAPALCDCCPGASARVPAGAAHSGTAFSAGAALCSRAGPDHLPSSPSRA